MNSGIVTTPAEFLGDVKSIAVIGVSEKSLKFGASAYRELKKLGYDVYPLHPTLKTFDGVPCYAAPADLPATPDCAFVSVRPDRAVAAVRQIAQRGIKKVWFQQGKDFSEAVKVADELGLQSVHGRCIMMYAGPVKGFHKVHRFFSRLFGKY